MTVEQAGEWFALRVEELTSDGRDHAQEIAAYSLAGMALGKYEELLDIDQDYKAAAETAASLQDRFCKVSAAIYESGETFRCPRCHSYVKWTYYHCPNCGQKLRRDTYRIRN